MGIQRKLCIFAISVKQGQINKHGHEHESGKTGKN